MRFTIYRLAIVVAAVLTPLASVALVSPGVGNATGCGPGTVYDAPSDTCVAAPLPPPPPPPAPAWHGDPTPGFSVGICAPIRFISLCTGF
ncbi:MAG TPA: hypothetical protein VH496_02390 [Mycobacterium sp.]|jgi:hypothetical protein